MIRGLMPSGPAAFRWLSLSSCLLTGVVAKVSEERVAVLSMGRGAVG